jgi:hypothetical protein
MLNHRLRISRDAKRIIARPSARSGRYNGRHDDRPAPELLDFLGGSSAARDQRRWIASADTPDGPSLGLGLSAVEAIEATLEPFEGIVDELLASLADASP